MSKEIQKLINKKKLTGVEVGKLMIKDMIVSLEAATKDPNFTELGDYPGLFTQAEREAMVAQLTGEKNIRDYNTYREVHNALLKLPMRFSMHKGSMESYFWRFFLFLDKLTQTEEENSQRRNNPVIMTQKQYDDLLKQAHDEAITTTDSIEGVFFNVLDFYLSMYKEGKRTPHNKHFTAAKKRKITNPRIRENYWEPGENGHYVTPEGKTKNDMTEEEWEAEIVRWNDGKEAEIDRDPSLDPLKWIDDGTAAPDTATMFDVLEYAGGFYSWAENENEAYFAEFAADFPGLYKDLLHEITHQKGLEFLTGRTDFFNMDLIPWQALYDNNLYNYRKMIDNIEAVCYTGNNGIAILHPDHLPPSFRDTIDEKGYYVPAPSLMYKNYKIETFQDLYGEGILLLQKSIRGCLEECHATNEAVKLIAEAVGVPEIEKLSTHFQQIEADFFDGTNYQIRRLKDHIMRLDRYGLRIDAEATEKAQAMIGELFQPIQITDGKPTPENIKRAREYIGNIHNIYEHTEIIYSILRGAAHDEKQR